MNDRPWYLGPYFILTFTLTLVALAYPLTQKYETPILHDVVISAMLLSAFIGVVGRKWIFRILAALLLPMLFGTWFYDPAAGDLGSKVAGLATVLFLSVTFFTALFDVIQARRVDADMIFASIAVYLLFGIIIALVLMFLHNQAPGSVLGSLSDADPWGDGTDNLSVLLYFSLITLTSVGYGDMVPTSPAAKSIAVFTGIFGQLYVAILVAKLVGLHTAQAMEEAQR